MEVSRSHHAEFWGSARNWHWFAQHGVLSWGLPIWPQPEALSWTTGRKQRWSHLQGGKGCSSPSGQGTLRTVHLRISLVSEQMAWSPPGAWSTLRVRSSEPLRKPQSLFFLEHGPHRDHSLISHCAGRKGGKMEKRERRGGHIPSPGPEYPMGASPTCSLSGLRPRGQKSPKENPGGWLQGKFSLDSAPDLTLTPPFSRGPGPSAHSTHGACLTRTTALHGAVGSCRALGTGRVAASLVQVQALLTLGAEVVAEAGLAVLNLAF